MDARSRLTQREDEGANVSKFKPVFHGTLASPRENREGKFCHLLITELVTLMSSPDGYISLYVFPRPMAMDEDVYEITHTVQT